MDLQSPLVLLGMFREKYLQPPKAKSIERENHFISSALGPDKHSLPSLGAERRSLLSIGREEKGQGHGHPSIHSSIQADPCPHIEGWGSQPPCFHWQTQPSPAPSAFSQQSSPRQALLTERHCLSAQERSMRLFPAFRSCF